MSDHWYEVWADEGLPRPYLLLVLPAAEGGVMVFDPREDKVVHQTPSYEETKLWLLEDEYAQIASRMVRGEI
jgi:hypothetical protein